MKKINDYVVFEIDVTGLDKEHDYVNEMVALKVKNGVIIDAKHHLFGYNSINKMSKIYQDFFENFPVVVYNYCFIKSFINFEIGNEVIDVLRLSRKMYPMLDNHCIWTVAKYLNFNISKSNSLYNSALLINEIYKRINDDILDNEIKDFIKNNENITPAILQRKFLIGYNRAKRMLDNKEIKI